MHKKILGAALVSAILVGGVVSPTYAQGNCGARVDAYVKEVENNSSMAAARISNVLGLLEKAKKFHEAGKIKGCEKMLKRAKQVVSDAN